MNLYLTIKTIHILSSTVLLGTGMGIAFFMWRALASGNLQTQAFTARTTVLADFLFTLPAVVVQPATGIALIMLGGYDWTAPWLLATYGLYIMIGCCWLPVVWIQIQLRSMVLAAVENGDDQLPERYHRLYRWWFCLGWPAFTGVIALFFLMVLKRI